MESFKGLLLIFVILVFDVVLADEDSSDVPNDHSDFVFDLPDIVANLDTLWGEVQLEAFGARQVNGHI